MLNSYPYVWALQCYVARELGRDDEAMQAALHVLYLDPKDPNLLHNALHNLGYLTAKQGKRKEAIRYYRAALRYRPSAETHNALGALLIQEQDYAGAIQQYRQALDLGLETANLHYNMGVLMEMMQPDAAIEHFRKAVALGDDDVRTHGGLARSLTSAGKYDESIRVLSRGLAKFPEDVELCTGMAWLLAAAPGPDLRDGVRAVRLAEAACRKVERENASLLDVLAASYAEAGRFEDAVQTARRAATLARDEGNQRLAGLIEQRQRLYEMKRPYRLSPPHP
jgi:tetratricopeptide (TPR) repeat protein